MKVIYNKNTGEIKAVGDALAGEKQKSIDTGEIKAVGDALAGENEKSIDIDGRKIPSEITGTRVDDIENPSDVIRDENLRQPDDYERETIVRNIGRLRREKDELEKEINNGNLPDRASDRAVDSVLGDIESRLETLREDFRGRQNN